MAKLAALFILSNWHPVKGGLLRGYKIPLLVHLLFIKAFFPSLVLGNQATKTDLYDSKTPTQGRVCNYFYIWYIGIPGGAHACPEKGRGRMSPLFLIPVLSRNPRRGREAGKG